MSLDLDDETRERLGFAKAPEHATPDEMGDNIGNAWSVANRHRFRDRRKKPGVDGRHRRNWRHKRKAT